MWQREQRGSDGRIYAKEVVGRGKWAPLVESNQVACPRPAAIYLGQPPENSGSESDDSGEP
jgi:hypothetical protein